MSSFDYRRGLHAEWLETDGFGHASRGTASGPNTRRGHGLLTREAADGLPWVLVNHIEEWVEISSRKAPLTSTIYFDAGAPQQMTIHPRGYQHLADFSAAPFPRWIFQIEGYRVIRTVRCVRGGAGILVEYAITAANGSRPALFLRPMISGRRAGSLHQENPAIRSEVAADGNHLVLSPYSGVPEIHIRMPDEASFSAHPTWYRRVRLIGEKHDEEALLSPGEIVMPLSPERPAWLWLSTSPEPPPRTLEPPRVFAVEEKYPVEPRTALRRLLRWSRDPEAARFATDLAADSTLDESIWALALLAEDLDDEVLLKLTRGYAAEIDGAHLDARLAWIAAVVELARRGIVEPSLTAKALATVVALLDTDRKTARVSEDMLLEVRASAASWWTRCDERSLPRPGFPVEIQALWVNALAGAEILESVSGARGEGRFRQAFVKAADAVKRAFWNSEMNYLFDRLEPLPIGGSRPAQYVADSRISSAALVPLALRFDIFSPSRSRAVLQQARQSLPVAWVESGLPPRVYGLKAFADNEQGSPWLLALWNRAYARHPLPNLETIPMDSLPDLSVLPGDFTLPKSVRVPSFDAARPADRLPPEISRPSVLSLAAYLAALRPA